MNDQANCDQIKSQVAEEIQAKVSAEHPQLKTANFADFGKYLAIVDMLATNFQATLGPLEPANIQAYVAVALKILHGINGSLATS